MSKQRRVTLVCGPPCSGKSTWVREHAEPGDLIVDYDDIAQRLGSPRKHGHDYRYHRKVEAVIARCLQAIETGREQRTAWVIRSLPEPAVRQALATRLGADLVVIDDADDVLNSRADSRSDPTKTRAAIAAWRRASISPGA